MTTPASALSAKEQSIRDAAWKLVADRGEELLAAYLERFGTVLDADNAAELFPEYSESNETRARFIVAIHPAAEWVRDQLFHRAIALSEVGEVVFLAGGNGVGKTASALTGDVVYESTFNDLPLAKKLIHETLKAGKSIQIVHINRPIEDCLRGVLKRAVAHGRTVSIATLIQTHTQAAATIGTLFREFRDHPSVGFQFVNNSISDEPALQGLELPPKQDYGECSDALYAILESQRETLPAYLYEVTRGSPTDQCSEALTGTGQPSPDESAQAGSAETDRTGGKVVSISQSLAFETSESTGNAVAPDLPASDEEARRRIQTSLDESLIVEASAGTGKTTELVGRIVAVLASGKAKISQIAAVTFTHKAAGELKLRLREAIDKARQTSDASRPALELALEYLEEASIGTIHSFCAQLLRERPVEARVDPAFQELSEQEANRLYQKSFRSWLERRLAEPSPGLRRALARLAWRDGWDDGPPLEQLQFAGRKLMEWRDYPAAWRREPFARNEEIRTLLTKAREVADASSRPRRVTDNLYRGLLPARLFVQNLDRPEAASAPPDFDTLEAQVLKLGRDLRRDVKKGSGEYGGGITREDLVNARDQLLDWIDDFRKRADADLAAELRDEMAPLVDEYNQRKQRQGKLDFVDLLIFARNLIKDQQPVRHYLQQRFTHLFVDEFQDTDPLQAEILLLLAANDPTETNWRNVTPTPGKLFLVGDPKQSIYKFRRADIVLYQQVCNDLSQRGVGRVSLTRSFRSVPNIQAFVNASFDPEMTGDGHAEYARLEEHRPEPTGRPSVIALPVPKPYKTRLSKDAVNQSLPDAIAAFIAWLVQESGWQHIPRPGTVPEPIRARDIAVLFRRRTQAGKDLTREYARALEARGVDHLLAGSKSFHHREEVETLRAALTAIEWPEDELSVFATLKGSLFAIPDEMLLVHKHRSGRIHPFHRQEADPSVDAALTLLADLHRARNHRPFAATVNALLEATRAHAGFLLRPGGNQILANVARVADLARTYEMTGGVSFRGFVEELATQAEKDEASEAPVLEEDSDGVRLMTVHGAKGLEFPVVILADLTANLCARDPDMYVDGNQRLHATRLLRCAPWELLEHEADETIKERAEGVRVAYVAATRARDLLVIPAVGDEPYPIDGWLSPLDKALYPARDAWRHSQPADGCPKFGMSSVLERPLDFDRQDDNSVRPGLITPQRGTHKIVWWDPFHLKLGEEADYGLRQEDLLKDDGGVSLAAYQTWQTDRASTIHRASAPSLDVFLASQAKDAPPDAQPVEYIEVARAVRPGGRRFGALVHAILRDVALTADETAIRRTAELNGRVLGAPQVEIDAADAAVKTALWHPLLGSARQSERCHREYPVTLNLPNHQVLEGVIDLVFLNPQSPNPNWIVIDFKTDADVSERRIPYERQLQWYAHALTSLTGFPAHAILLGV